MWSALILLELVFTFKHLKQRDKPLDNRPVGCSSDKIGEKN